MKYTRLLAKGLFLGLALALLAACGQTITLGTVVTGSGNAQTATREISGVSSVVVSGSGTVNIAVTGTESLTIQADDNILPYLTSDLSNGRLELGTKPNVTIITRVNPVYTLTVKSLDDLTVSGSANVTLTDLNADKFNTMISGSGGVTATGRADNLTVNISGSGSFGGDGLIAKDGSVVISGSGQTVINASDTLTANVSGSGNVQYIGKPTLNVQSTGSGNVSQR